MLKGSKELMLSGISYALLLLVIYFVHCRESVFLVYIAAALILIALIFPIFFKPINIIVQPAGKFLINLIVNTLLILIFYFLFSPIAIIRRLVLKGGIIKNEIDKNCTTYFIDKPEIKYDRSFFERLY